MVKTPTGGGVGSYLALSHLEPISRLAWFLVWEAIMGELNSAHQARDDGGQNESIKTFIYIWWTRTLNGWINEPPLDQGLCQEYLRVWLISILTPTFWGKDFYLHFKGKDSESQSGKFYFLRHHKTASESRNRKSVDSPLFHAWLQNSTLCPRAGTWEKWEERKKPPYTWRARGLAERDNMPFRSDGSGGQVHPPQRSRCCEDWGRRAGRRPRAWTGCASTGSQFRRAWRLHNEGQAGLVHL